MNDGERSIWTARKAEERGDSCMRDEARGIAASVAKVPDAGHFTHGKHPRLPIFRALLHRQAAGGSGDDDPDKCSVGIIF